MYEVSRRAASLRSSSGPAAVSSCSLSERAEPSSRGVALAGDAHRDLQAWPQGTDLPKRSAAERGERTPKHLL